MIGRTIDRYRVIEQLGQGGMGVVYRALDTLLDRFVALKFLPPDHSSDPDRRRRFLQEARAASALNHPGIVSVFDVLTVDGQDVLVLELVEGETLEALLTRRRLPIGEALGIAARVAEAIARAHAAGIVHRDLKPSNVMVTGDGVKVLDFGLAKLAEPPLPSTAAPTAALEESPLTRERAVVGTVPYMSPEQAAGRPVDARSDIFAFGVLLYEMLTARHPFRSATTTETLAAIQERDPEPPTRIVPGLPPEVDRIVLRCLRKDPAKRWQSLSDLGAVLEDLKQDSDSGRQLVADSPGSARGRRRWLLVAAATLAAVAMSTAAFLLIRRPPPGEAPLDMRRLTFDGGASVTPAISPDGTLIAYASDRAGDGQNDIWVRHINRPEPARLTDDPADEWMPRFSPDGSRIVFRSERDGGGIYIVNTLGGEPRKLTSGGNCPRFSPDGSLVLFFDTPPFSPSGLHPMFLVSAEGGAARPFLPEFGVVPVPNSIGPLWSPDGSLVLFRGGTLDGPSQRDWWVANVDGSPPVSSGAMQSLPKIDMIQYPCVWLRDRLLFLAGTTIEGINLYSARITAEGRVEGPVQALTTGPGMMLTPSVANDGRIAFEKFQVVSNLWQFDLDPATGRAMGDPVQLTDDAPPKFAVSISRDGSKVAYSAYSGPRERRLSEVRVRDLASGRESVPVSIPALTLSLEPRLSPDASLLTWSDLIERQRVSFLTSVAEPDRRELCRGCVGLSFLSTGEEALFVRPPNRIVRLRLADAAETLILDSGELRILDVDLSWDDRWLVVATGSADGRIALYVVPIRDSPLPQSEWIEIDDGSRWRGSPRWSADGRLLYYFSDRDGFTCLWAQPLDPAAMQPAGEPFPVLHAHHNRMKVPAVMRSSASLAVERRRVVLSASKMTGDIYTAMLEPG